MKKLLFIFSFLLIFTMSSSAQFKFGAGLSYNWGDFIGLRGQGAFDISDSWKGQAAFSYFFESGITVWSIDLDGHYKLIELSNNEDFIITPFSGLNFSSFGTTIGGTNTELGINVGVQLQAPLTDDLELFIEPKFIIEGIGGFVLSAGVLF